MTGNEGVAWARRVVDRGWPRKDAPISERIEAYEDLAAAYETLAADAAEHGHQGSALAFRDLAEHAQRFAQRLRADEAWR